MTQICARSSLASLVLILGALASLALAGPLEATELATEVGLLIGRPPAEGQAPESEGVLVVPGIVLPVQPDTYLPKLPADQEERLMVRNRRLGKVAAGLQESLRLANIEVRYQMRLDLGLDAIEELPPPARNSRVRITVRLLGYNASTASYEVEFFDGQTPITKTPLTVERGKQAVVGGLDGPEAPYLFLVLAPDADHAPRSESTADGPLYVQGDVTPPLPVEKTPPAYTPEAKKARIQGVVIVQAVIGVDGRVSQAKLLKGLPMGLSEAAGVAIREWKFEPSTLNGEPVEVYYNLTINFRLPPSEKTDDGL